MLLHSSFDLTFFIVSKVLKLLIVFFLLHTGGGIQAKIGPIHLKILQIMHVFQVFLERLIRR